MSVTNSFGFSPIVPSVNYHLWEPCNMRCRFCFATFQDVKRDMRLPKGHLPEKDSIKVVEKLAEAGFEKNAKGAHNYSKPILEVGVHAALKTVSIDADRFLRRGGKYDW